MPYCTDTDLLYWEPNLFRDASFAAQTLLSGTASIAGTLFTLADGSLLDSRIASGMVVTLSTGVIGCFPIVSVDTPTELTLSILYDGLYPTGNTQPNPAPVGAWPAVNYAIHSFQPQSSIVSALLNQAAGLDNPLSNPPTVVNRDVLRRPCALGTLQMIYNALAASGPDASKNAVRAELYRRLYRRAVYETRVELDLNNDGRPDCARPLNVARLQRA